MSTFERFVMGTTFLHSDDEELPPMNMNTRITEVATGIRNKPHDWWLYLTLPKR